MKPTVRLFSSTAGLLIFSFGAGVALAQDLQKGVTYVCNGERMFIENCNIRDTSDTSKCMVGHPDTVLPNGLMKYTYETRGDLKKLFPTCKQPSAQEVERAKAFEKKQNDLYEANKKKAEDELNAIEARQQQAITGKKPLTPEERTLNRCITSGRLPASCTGNALLGGFTQMIGQMLPDVAKEAGPGPNMAGAFEGAGGWRIDFITDGVLVNCSMLAPNQQNYTIEFKGPRPTVVIDTTPKPLVLTYTAEGTLTAPGPITIDGVIVSGYTEGTTQRYGYAKEDVYGNKYDIYGNKTDSGSKITTPGHANFSPKRTTCPAVNVSSKGARVGIETMQTDLLKTAFGGDKGPPTPPGIRMHGIYATSTGFSVQFFPESAILGCGPDAARAYPYHVATDAGRAVIRVEAPDHPLNLAFRPDGSLDPGATGPYQVHGRVITGQNANDDFTFAPMELTCNLGELAPSKTIPSSGGTAATVTASGPGGAPNNGGGTLSTPQAPLGNAVLTILSGFPAEPNKMNPLAGFPYTLMRDSFSNALAKGGVQIPAGVAPFKAFGQACQNRAPECQSMMQIWKANAISAARADITGKAVLPGVPPGPYYMLVSIRINNQPILWDVKVDLKSGANSLTLDPKNAVPIK